MTEVLGEYNGWLVLLSYFTAVLAAYTALDLSERVVHTKGRKNIGWLLAGSLTMGLGIWSMHFIGMVSFHTAEEMKYDLKFVLLSIVAAFAGSLISFYVVNEKNRRMEDWRPGPLQWDAQLPPCILSGWKQWKI
ncbi:MHYT domain-containing protein [Bacillus licheniformis]|uniref:MHYT domain-containing protein n=1 Tax=Bacillus licheniformis TaxID=1402 RepID=UPI0013600A56|nr:MHYT domain-containing protein [Bacillus licheniformis]TWK30203.1 putative signaling protein [Bacillus licheniformis]